MKKFTFLIVIPLLFCSAIVCAQGGYIYTVAGNGSAGYSGDGSLAQSAELNGPTDACLGHSGDIYIADQGNNRIRRVNAATGIITTVAGNGTTGYTGDGGPATAATLSSPNYIAVDGAGNIYIADQGNNVIRKINTSGVIFTIVGTGTAGDGGDGGISTLANLNSPTAVAVDGTGNIYITDNGNARVRKVNTSGIITTIAGGGISTYSVDGVPATSLSLCTLNSIAVDAVGNVYFSNLSCWHFLKISPSGLIYDVAGYDSPGYSGDGGPADSANVEFPYGISSDIFGNVYICPQGNVRVRKVDGATNIINTIAGNGTAGFSGDGGPATASEVSSSINGIYSDIIGNVYFADQGNNRIRLITSSLIATYNADSFSVFVNKLCSGPQLTISTNRYLSTFSQTTYYGDGTSYTSPILDGYGGTSGYSTFSHSYSYPGTYSLKTMLSNGASPIDSFMYTYEYTQCVTMPVKFYYDINGNCLKDTGEQYNAQPVVTEVDSNGIPIDTLSSTSGFYYSALGMPGDIYTFRILSVAGGLAVTCPASGVFYDTIVAGVNNLYTKYVALQCISGSGFDLAINTIIPVTGVHDEWGNVYVSNNSCYPLSTDAVVTVHYSRKYNVEEGGGYLDVHPSPTSYTDSTITWNVSGLLSTASAPVDLYYAIWSAPATGYLTIGDTVHTYVTVSPTVGDIDLTNNYCFIQDTVKAGCDPNEMWVAPTGYIASGTQLKYTAEFQNTGNDTAHNIYIMDTLSNDLDPHSLRVVSASATMNIGMYSSGGHTIVKFDFPGINLLDSSHHGLCTGMVIFTINSRTGLPDCSHIVNYAGIFFDVNAVVMTDTVENIIGIAPTLAPITGTANVVCLGASVILSDSIAGGSWSASNSNASIVGGVVTGVTTGTVNISYTVPAACGPASVTYPMVVGVPSAGSIVSPPTICVGSSVDLGETAPGGVWSIYGSIATISGGVLTGMTVGSDTIDYTITNSCGSASTMQAISVTNIVPSAGSISGAANICVGSSITMSDPISGGAWSSTGDATISTGTVIGVVAGIDTISYSVTNTCGTAIATHVITVNPLPDPGTILGIPYVCVGSTIILSETSSDGIWHARNGNASISDGDVAGITPGVDSVIYTVSNTFCSASVAVVITILPDSVCIPTAINSISVPATSLKIFPNPTTDELNIMMAQNAYNTCIITNNLGQALLTQPLNVAQTNVNIKALPAGMYYITLKGDNGSTVQRFVKM